MERVFKALADETRLRILGLLLNGEVCVCHFQGTPQIAQPKTSRHLAYLRRAGLVDTRREGLWIYYRLATVAEPVLATIIDAVRHALTHAERIRRGADRLERRTGQCAAATAARPGLPCCAEAARIARADRRTSTSSRATRRQPPVTRPSPA